MRGIKLNLLLTVLSLTIFLQGCSQSSESNAVKNGNANQPEVSNLNGNSGVANASNNFGVNNQPASNTNSIPTVDRKTAPSAPEPKPNFGSGAADLSIIMSARNKLSSDKDLINSVIVDAKEGNVTLTGKVSSEEQKKKAEELTKSVQGVKSVKNNLRVSP